MAGAFDLWRLGFARILDIVGQALLTWLGWQVMFGESQPFQASALLVGVVAAVACVTSPGARRELPIPMLTYAGIALLSAAVRHSPNGGSVEWQWWIPFQPAFHLVNMCLFVWGTAHLLRTPLRLAVFTVLLVGAISVLAVQTLYDRTTFGFVFERYGSRTLPTVAQWFGLHQVGLLMVLALPFTLSLAVLGRSVAEVSAGAVLSGGLFLVAYLNASTGGVLAMILTGALMVATKVHLLRRVWLTRSFYAFVLVAVIGGAAFLGARPVAVDDAQPLAWAGQRGPIWQAAWRMFLDHFWLGVGPGNYPHSMVADGYASTYLPGYPGVGSGVVQAHNAPLQVFAEVGVLGGLSFLAMFVVMSRACWRTFTHGHIPFIAFGVLFTVIALFIRLLSDDLLDLALSGDRVRVLAWLCFAAAVGVGRLREPVRAAGRW